MATNSPANTPTGTSGTVLQGQGAGVALALSTATFPSTATGTGKILRADGTNWVATTATFPDTAGTSGNVLTSNGTNWTSVAPAGGSSYALMMNSDSFNPADSTTYYWADGNGGSGDTPTSTLTVARRNYIPKTGTITVCLGAVSITGTLGTNENCTIGIRLNDTTNTNVSTTLTLDATGNTFSNTGLTIAVTQGDYITMFFTSPAFATNPTSVSFKVSLFIS